MTIPKVHDCASVAISTKFLAEFTEQIPDQRIVLRVEGRNYVVRGENGKEVSLHVDSTTQKTEDISQGYSIEAQVNDQNHALSIRSTPTTDRRNEKSESMLAQ